MEEEQGKEHRDSEPLWSRKLVVGGLCWELLLQPAVIVGHQKVANCYHTSEPTNNIPSVRVEGPQSHPVRALEQWCPDLPKVSAALKFSARCARSCKLYSIVQAAVWYKLLVLRYSCIQLYLP